MPTVYQLIRLYTRYIVPFTDIFPIVTGIMAWPYLKKNYRFILIYAIYSAVFNFIFAYFAAHHKHNLFLLPFYSAGELCIYCGFFYYQFNDKAGLRRMVILAALLYLPICLANYIFFQDLDQNNTYSRSYETITIILLSAILMLKDGQQAQQRSWIESPTNWFNTGVLLYFSTATTIFLLSNILIKTSMTVALTAWFIHAIFLMVMYILYGIGFVKCKQQATT